MQLHDDCVSIWLWNITGSLSCQWSVLISGSRGYVVGWNSIWTHSNHSPSLKHSCRPKSLDETSATPPLVHAAEGTAQTADTTDNKWDYQDSNNQRNKNGQRCKCKLKNVTTVHFTMSIVTAVFIIWIIEKDSGTRIDEFINRIFTCSQCTIHSINSMENLE